MNEEALASTLSAIVKKHEKWDVKFDHLTMHVEPNFTEVTWTDAGVGEDYVLDAARKEWPDRYITIDIDGGCDSCGFGRHLSMTISGSPPWEVM